MSDDAEELTNIRIYRVAYSYDRTGWCVWEETKDHRLSFNTGPFDTEAEAEDMMSEMNIAQGF